MQPVELVVETRAQLRLLLGHSHAVVNVCRGSHLHLANGVGSHHVNVPAIPAATWSAFFLRAVSPPCGFHLASATLVASTGMDAARGSVFDNIPTVGVLHKLFKHLRSLR